MFYFAMTIFFEPLLNQAAIDPYLSEPMILAGVRYFVISHTSEMLLLYLFHSFLNIVEELISSSPFLRQRFAIRENGLIIDIRGKNERDGKLIDCVKSTISRIKKDGQGRGGVVKDG